MVRYSIYFDSDEPDKAAKEINSWVLEQTNQKIKDIISPDFIDPTQWRNPHWSIPVNEQVALWS